MSPSSQRVWIEIEKNLEYDNVFKSPSSQRVWIEIALYFSAIKPFTSPSSQRVWIEIVCAKEYFGCYKCHPLHRWCGLKSIFGVVKVFKDSRHPLHRGCGLKSKKF